MKERVASLPARALIQLDAVSRFFPVKSKGFFFKQQVRAVDGVSLSIQSGETVALVGESGSGKSTLGRVAIGLQPATSGSVFFEENNLAKISRSSRRQLRRRMQIVFQDPFGSLNPRLPIGDQIEEGLIAHNLGNGPARRARVGEVLDLVGLPSDYGARYPHEFSGGQRQRIGIARALAVNPEFVVLDEPVSALDVSIQSQVLNLLADLRKEKGLTYLFISHNLDVVGYFSDRVAVMYLGKIVESGPVEQVFTAPQHPYTIALLSAVPKIQAHDAGDRLILEGEIPSPINPPSGCRFRTRCWLREQLGNPERCTTEEPLLAASPKALDVAVACHFPLEDGRASITKAGRLAAVAGLKVNS